jgi:hypothetical protein
LAVLATSKNGQLFGQSFGLPACNKIYHHGQTSQQYVLTFILSFDVDILAFLALQLFWLLFKMGNYLGNLLVTLTSYKIMDKLPDNML